MIGKDYFRRQAITLRKMVGLAQNKVAAEQLAHLAESFEAKAKEADAPGDQVSSEAEENRARPQ